MIVLSLCFGHITQLEKFKSLTASVSALHFSEEHSDCMYNWMSEGYQKENDCVILHMRAVL